MDIASLLETVDQADRAFYRLVLLVGPCGSGKTSLLRAFSRQVGCPLLQTGFQLGQVLLDRRRRQRSRQADRLFRGLVESAAGAVVLLDNVEILFEPELCLDPLKLLQSTSRNRTLVVGWPGRLVAGALSYAEPGHPHHKAYPNPEAILVPLSRNGSEARP